MGYHSKGQYAEIDEMWPEYIRGVCFIVLKLKTGKRIRFQGSGLQLRCGDVRNLIEQRVTHIRSAAAAVQIDAG